MPASARLVYVECEPSSAAALRTRLPSKECACGWRRRCIAIKVPKWFIEQEGVRLSFALVTILE